jgi:hypothetical protein
MPEQECGHSVSRRNFIKIGTLGYLGISLSQFLELEAAHASPDGPAATSVILLWMDGGPSHTDTFDPKPEGDSDVRGEFSAIPTNIAGIQVSEHLPLMARQMDKVTLIRAMSHNEGAHERACHTLLTGWHPLPALTYPSMGSVTAKELGMSGALPPYIAVPGGAFGQGYGQSGYLEAAYNPFSVPGDPNRAGFSVQDVSLPQGITRERLDRRRSLLQAMDGLYSQLDKSEAFQARDHFYQQAYTMITSAQTRKAFNIDEEPDAIRDLYGRNSFGQSCLLARRLVEAGVHFVTVNMGGWDTHVNNFKALKDNLLPPLDQGFAALLQDLHSRGILQHTLVLWMGEFGRTPHVNERAGRDHWPHSQTIVAAGAGVPGGHVLGSTDRNGTGPIDKSVSPADLVATVYTKLGIDIDEHYKTPEGRPIKIIAGGAPIEQLG